MLGILECFRDLGMRCVVIPCVQDEICACGFEASTASQQSQLIR